MKYSEKVKHFPIWPLYVIAALSVIFLSFYFYSQSLIRVDAPEPDLGEKVIIALPDGNRVYTYESFIIEENGKLLYKGERNTIDFTGGTVKYENWNN